MKTLMQELVEELKANDVAHGMYWIKQPNDFFDKYLEKEKEQIGYTEEQAYEIWKAGQKYWETSGKSITFEDLIEKFKPKAILQPNL